MTRLPGYIDGKRSITLPAHKRSFCRGPFRCCSEVPDTFPVLLQFEAGSSGSEYVFHCIMVTMTKINMTTWTGSFTAPDCLRASTTEDEIPLEFTCDNDSPASPEDCKQVFGFSINGFAIDEDNCCCFDSDPDLTGVETGLFCLVGGLGTLWEDARDGDGTGCNCTTWLLADESNGSIPIVWMYDEDEYGGACCEPSPCPDACCPTHATCGVAEATAGPESMAELDEDVQRWLGDLQA